MQRRQGTRSVMDRLGGADEYTQSQTTGLGSRMLHTHRSKDKHKTTLAKGELSQKGSRGSRDVKQDQGSDSVYLEEQPQLENQTPEAGCCKYRSMPITQGRTPRKLQEKEIHKQWPGQRKLIGQGGITGRKGIRRVRMVTQQSVSKDKDKQRRRNMRSAMDEASLGAQELVMARRTGQDLPRPPSRIFSRKLHIHGRLHEYVSMRLVVDVDKGGLGRSARQRSQDQTVGGRQPTGQELQGRIPKKD